MVSEQPNNIDELKDLEFYAATCNAWYQTLLERDKGLLNLSAAGIGLLITLISLMGKISIEILSLYIVAAVSFLLCIGSVLIILKRNADHLLVVVKERQGPDSILSMLDNLAITSFIVAVVLSFLIGIFAGYHALQLTEPADMSSNRPFKSHVTTDSFCNANLLRFSSEDKSFNGANALKPSRQSDAPGQQASPPETARDVSQAQNQGSTSK